MLTLMSYPCWSDMNYNEGKQLESPVDPVKIKLAPDIQEKCQTQRI